MDNLETKVYLETKLRNLKRKHAKLAQHADLTDEYISIGKEIKDVENQLKLIELSFFFTMMWI